MESAKKENYFHYNKNLKTKARDLRMNMTKAEACLWKYVLSGRKINGFQFRRQRPVLKYIADFMCKELKLIIEVDGITHTYESVHENDIRRQEELEKSGFTVLRYTDEEILTNINNVKQNLEDWIIENNPITTPLIPRQQGTKQDN